MKIYTVEIQNNQKDGTTNDEKFFHATFAGALNRLKRQNFEYLHGEATEEKLEQLVSENYKMGLYSKLENLQFGFDFLDKNQYANIDIMEICD